jgi:hypothetical protein
MSTASIPVPDAAVSCPENRSGRLDCQMQSGNSRWLNLEWVQGQFLAATPNFYALAEMIPDWTIELGGSALSVADPSELHA